MNAFELHRNLIYKGHTELSAFLEESPVNYTLYEFLRDVKPRHQVNMTMASILNEVYYLCIRASRDLTPGDNIHERYISEEKAWTGSSVASELIFSAVVILLRMQKKLSYPLETFAHIIGNLCSDCNFASDVERFIQALRSKGEEWESDFTPQPIAATDLPSYTEPRLTSYIDTIIHDGKNRENPWRTLTNNYAHSHILDFLRCYKTIEDQRILLDRIKESSRTEERLAMLDFYQETQELIDMGEYLPRMIEKPEKSPSDDPKAKELAIAYQQIELLKQQKEDMKQHYTYRLSEQSAEFDRRLAYMESRYKVENIENTQKLVEKYEVKTMQAEPSLTIAELADHAKTQCSRQGAEAVAAMLYRLAGIHGFTDKSTFGLIEAIIPAIDQREARHQTFDMPNVEQFNNNPQTVNNHPKVDA